ncbi:GAF domain-containing protein [Saccharopolyspora griseoalba]|uniref:GAF domain-containing protein n=1 Tax=Saccharopolyspora griseoalba TaxID=1431848 RepID=A0ABW2LRK8_9PSEU
MTDVNELRAKHYGNPLEDDPGAGARRQRLQQYGLARSGVVELDSFAADFAKEVRQMAGGTPYTMVNLFFDGDAEPVQYFAGLHDPHGGMSRTMGLDQGFCAHVVRRRKALQLDDVCDYPRFGVNPALDLLNIRTYLGAPIVDADGTVIGTVCTVDTDVKEYGSDGVDFIKSKAAAALDLVKTR